MIRKVFGLAAVVIVPAGCGSVADVGSKIPFVYHDPKATADAVPFQWNAHRQYFDKLHRRYYYYDPVRKNYFWEDGQPKG